MNLFNEEEFEELFSRINNIISKQDLKEYLSNLNQMIEEAGFYRQRMISSAFGI